MKRKKVLTVTLNPAVDKTVFVPHFKTGNDFREEGICISAGGKGLNVSRALKHMDMNSIALAFSAGPNGQLLKQILKKEKIDYSFTEVKGNSRVSLTIMCTKTGKITRILERGPAVKKDDIRRFINNYITHASKCGYITLSGRNIPGTHDRLYAELISRGKKAGAMVIFDTSGKALLRGVKRKPDMLKPNLQETEQLLGCRIRTRSDIKSAIRDILDMGVKIVAITLGSGGSICSDGNRVVEAIPPKLKRKNPVGCGDSFIAGYIKADFAGMDFADKIRFATASGSANVLSLIPGLLSSKDINRIMREVKVREIKSRSHSQL